MKVLVTGSSGFIGKHLLGKLDDCIPFDRFPENAIGNGDITILDDIINASKDCDGIIHLAAISRVSDCQDNPKRCIDVNINGTLNVILSAIKNNINWIGVVTTGEIEWIENQETQSFKKIDNLYGVSKLTTELLVDVVGTKANLKSTIYRISSAVFGEGDNPKKVLPLFISKSINGEDITINDVESDWDFIHVDDVVDTIKKFLFDKKESKDCIKEINIFSGVRLNLLSLAKIIHFLSNSTSNINYGNISINKVTSSEFNTILNERQIPEQFINQISNLIATN